MLTIELRRALAGKPFEAIARDVSNDIYAQLSDYAKSVLAPHIQQSGLSFDAQQPGAQTVYRHEELDAVYFLKSRQRCLLQMIDGTTYRGRIEVSGDDIVLLTDGGETVLLPDDHSTYSLKPEA